jgi:hypothetical protein
MNTYFHDFRVAIYGICISNRIYWTLTERNYKCLCFHCSIHFTNHCNHNTHKVFSVCNVFTSHCLVTDPNNVLFFRAHVLIGCLLSQLAHCSKCLACNISARTAFQLLPCKHACLRSRYSVTAVL